MRDPSAITRFWELEYARLARGIAPLLPRGPTALVELGCGRGSLTLPLARLRRESRIDAVDRFAAPYPSKQPLLKGVASAGLADRVRVLSGDAEQVLRRLPPGSRDAIVSSEFLSELTASRLVALFTACHRALKRGGVTVHAFLSPVPRSPGQELTIEADSDPRWTTHPAAQWFSPPPEVVQRSLAKAGFADRNVRWIRSRLRLLGPAARAQLKRWGVRETFYQHHRDRLRSEGLELPDWTIVSGVRKG